MMTMPPSRALRARGFTLLELTFVILIVGIVAAVGIIRLGRISIFMAEGERVARRLVADLRYARSEAITHAQNHYILFTEGATKYTSYAIYCVRPAGDTQIEPTRVLPDSVAVTGSATRAEFNPGGDAVAAYTYNVTSPGTSYQVTITLVATGAVTLEEL